MGRKGRPKKQGERYKCGKLRPTFDKGSERVQALRERYGEYYGSALGRAFKHGLLGSDATANVRFDAGKRFARLYSAMIERGRYGCPLGRETLSAGSCGQISGNSFEMDNQEWLFDAMNDLDNAGLRPWLDQLILDQYHDHGPPWLDRLLAGGRDPADRMVMKCALDALDVIAPAQVEIGIRVVRWDDAA
ncbi:hypothetical protein [Novosphingobium mathurense]|uniref:Uncharacterized protein n=1 Tax=Novosphingobium mathurense TaxID=428990 RepID=A0A1U6I790_9SPHN|nr:hypothetical protein [Novosphingobium mathurense]SLK03885.1 hypothetical protein SAMN06295987_104298 [Novosphingobium mathurense]